MKEHKQICITTSLESRFMYQLTKDLNKFGYHTSQDYYVTTRHNPMSSPCVLMTIHIQNPRMLQDTGVRELLLEHLI